MDMSVSEQIRAAKDALSQSAVKDLLLGNGGGVPVTGQYYDLIRAQQQVRTGAPSALTNPFIRGINNQRGGVKSFAAANYKYPSGQMVIGAALAGCPSCAAKGLGRVGTGVAKDEGSDFTFTVPAAKVNAAFPEGSVDYSLMNVSWMSSMGPFKYLDSGHGCRTQMTNNSGGEVLGLKTGTFNYKNTDKMRRIKAAAVVQAMNDAGIALTVPNLYFYGQLKAHDVGELTNLMKQYPPGSQLPGNLLGDGSGERSYYCRADFDMASFTDPKKVEQAISLAQEAYKKAQPPAQQQPPTGGYTGPMGPGQYGQGGYAQYGQGGYGNYGKYGQEQGMSTGTKVAIGVGVVAALGAAAYFMMRK
jgi:hypothetical protein